MFKNYLGSFSVINNLFDTFSLFLFQSAKSFWTSINIKIYIQILFDPSLEGGRVCLSQEKTP